MSHVERLLSQSGHCPRMCFETETNNTSWTCLLKIDSVESVAVGKEVLESRAQSSGMQFIRGHCLSFEWLLLVSVVLGKLYVWRKVLVLSRL